jgi:glutathione synthase
MGTVKRTTATTKSEKKKKIIEIMSSSPSSSSSSSSPLLDEAIENALSLGILMVTKDGSLAHAPFTLRASPVPIDCFNLAVQVAPLFNALIDRVSRDSAFLNETLTLAAAADDFLDKQLTLYNDVAPRQPFVLGVHRHDYMFHFDAAGERHVLQQVEMNTISAAFSSLGQATSELHRFLARNGDDAPSPALPKNESANGHADAIAQAHRLYADPDAVVLIVVLPGEKNVFDQRALERTLFSRHGVVCVRKTLAQLGVEARVDDDNDGALTLADGRRVSVAYFRAGYAPEHYGSDVEWRARAVIERSRAIKSPSIGYQLAGSKKVQQELARVDVLERFARSADDAALMRQCFAGLFTLDGDEGAQNAERALADRQGYVLKPQREGGGNNLYGDDLHAKLSKAPAAERSAYILMTRISPRPIDITVVRSNAALPIVGVSELGTFGGFLGNGVDEPLLNRSLGHLLRTKAASQEDGGVASGVAVLDSPFLI